MANERFELEKSLPAPPLPVLDEQRRYPLKPDWSDSSGYEGYGYPDGGDNNINPREIWRKIRKYKWLILSVVTVVTTLVSIQVYRTKPWYTATTIIEIGKENTTVLRSGDLTLNDQSDPDYLVNINTKILILNSNDLLEDVVVDLKLDQQLPNAQASPKNVLDAVWATAKEVATPLAAGNQTTKFAPVAAGEIETGETVRSAEDSVRLAPFVRALKGGVSSEQIKNTRAIKVSFTNEDPQLAARVTNSIAKVFRQRNFDKITERFTNSSDWLDTSTRQLKAKVEAAEQGLAKYTRDNQIYSTGDSADSKGLTLTVAKLTQLHDQHIRAQTDRIIKQSLYDQVAAGRVAELPDAFSDPKLTQAQKRLEQLNQQFAEIKVKFGPLNTKYTEVQNQIAVVTAEIESSLKGLENKLKTDYERVLRDEKSLLAALDAAKADAVRENQASIRYNILKQDVDTARSLYSDFLQKSNQAKAQVAEQNNNIKIIQQAQVPDIPDGPRRAQTIIIGFFLSLGAGIGLAFLLEYLDNTIKSVEDVERYAQLPALGIIPKFSALLPGYFREKLNGARRSDGTDLSLRHRGSENSVQTDLLANLEKQSALSEAYRALRTSILLSAAGNPPKTILVTSAHPSEGKTTTAVNTAISLGQLGANVIIIDCDLRRPSMHKRLDITSGHGLSTYLTSDADVNDLIQQLDIPNLSAIPCGPTPPNPAELLSSPKMRNLLKVLAENYDHIILDSPPIINVTDPIILSTMVDGTILVIKSGETTREAVQRCRQELTNVRAKMFGVILNNVNLRRDGYDYYYSKYKSNDSYVTDN